VHFHATFPGYLPSGHFTNTYIVYANVCACFCLPSMRCLSNHCWRLLL
jgi:hypothetical protein